jgi:hypothetical protein
MNELTTIDFATLDTVTGGEGQGPNQTNVEGNINVQTPVGVSVSGQGKYNSSRTDYAQCLDVVRGAGGTPQQMRDFCGLPPGANQGAGQ